MVLCLALLGGAAASASAQGTGGDMPPSTARTLYRSICGGKTVPGPEKGCESFDGYEIRNDTSIFLVGFDSNPEDKDKHVFQAVAVFDLSAAKPGPDQVVSGASLSYGENSTVRRAASGDTEYGILETCNTKLGVPSGAWDGSSNLVQTTPAQVAGRVPATTGSGGSWDVTPQLRAWLSTGQQQGTLVMQGDDESPDIREDTRCLSYVGDLVLSVQFAPKP